MAISASIDSNEFIVLFVGVTTTVACAKAKRYLHIYMQFCLSHDALRYAPGFWYLILIGYLLSFSHDSFIATVMRLHAVLHFHALPLVGQAPGIFEYFVDL